ncbi:hypothetical protein GN958_ATG09364 [Phytophthora infestans]|uniref:RING-type domain-containing protein n=1 Tax=Phytophthora infestans TaxID=4787 RepID=A0A8S9ULI2_PHYIN|nr:hypothetical protein GN958_ATG09364 [Phytophthora infestans]
MSRAISEGLAAARRQCDTPYHRERRRQQREPVGTQDQLVSDDVQIRLDQLLKSDDRHADQVDDFDTDNPTQHNYTQDQVARDDDDYAHDLLDQLLLTGDGELSDIVAVPNVLELEHKDNDDHRESQGKATGRDGVTDCVMCLYPLDGDAWVCDQDSCRQPYHHECIKRTFPVDPRCCNCRVYVYLEVEDDDVIIAKHVAAPPTCVVCLRVITDVVLEGPQCSHTVDYECLVAYNAQYLRNIRARDLQCPACSQPGKDVRKLTISSQQQLIKEIMCIIIVITSNLILGVIMLSRIVRVEIIHLVRMPIIRLEQLVQPNLHIIRHQLVLGSNGLPLLTTSLSVVWCVALPPRCSQLVPVLDAIGEIAAPTPSLMARDMVPVPLDPMPIHVTKLARGRRDTAEASLLVQP